MNSVEHYYETPPEKQFFYKAFAVATTFFGLGTYKWWHYEYSKPFKYFLYSFYYIVLVACPVCFISQIVYIRTRYNEIDFETHSSIYTLIPVSVLVVIKVTSAQLPAYKDLMKRFMREIHLHNFKNQDTFMKEKAIEAERYSRYLTYFFITFLIIDWALWSLFPVIVSYQHIEEIRNHTRPYQTCVYVWLPFDYEHDFTNWVIVHSLTSCITCVGCCIVITFDTLNYAIVFHLIGHIKFLKYKIGTKFTSNLNDEEITRNLKEIIDYHCFVLQTFSDIEKAFGMNVTSNYIYNLVGDSLLLYHLMVGDKGNKLTYGFMLFAFMGGLILMTAVFEEVRRQTDDISEIVYNIPWEEMSLSNQKTVMVILARTQPTLEFVAAGGLIAGVKPTLNKFFGYTVANTLVHDKSHIKFFILLSVVIIKSTFSYYVMLNSSL